MFERYTEQARRAIFFARYEASQFGSKQIEPEHLLLGVIRQMNLPGDAIRSEIAQLWARDKPTPTSTDLPVSHAVKRAMAYAAEEATKLGHKHIGVEHLLLALMVEQPNSIVPDLLRKHGIDRAKALSGIADAPAEAPVDRDSLRALVDSLPQESLRHAKRMLEHMQTPRPFPPPPPFGEQGGWIGGGGGGRAGGWNFAGPGVRGTPRGPMRQGRHSRSRMEDGVEVVETRHLRDGCEITVIERFRLSEDGKTLSYTQEVTGPDKSERHTIDFKVE
jgi:hypothetical protein